MFVNYNHPTADLFDMQCFSFCLLLGFKGIFLRNKTKVKNLKDSFVTVFLLLSCLQQLQKKKKKAMPGAVTVMGEGLLLSLWLPSADCEIGRPWPHPHDLWSFHRVISTAKSWSVGIISVG